MKALPMILGLALVVSACTGSEAVPTTIGQTSSTGALLADGSPVPPAPITPSGPLDPALAADLDLVFADLSEGTDYAAIARVGASGDARAAWLLSDMLRFFPRGPVRDETVGAFQHLTGVDIDTPFPWIEVTDLLIAWDLEAPPGYVEWKRRPFEIIEPAWAPFFDDADADIDWRHLSWGGVLIDDRPLDSVDQPCPAGCIPALDFPGLTDAAGGDWYADDRIVFGVVVDGEARAYPKHMMEVHEMINDELGGRRIAIPYCTLCGSAQAYYTDQMPEGVETLELRTSGLLVRSNKVMFDLHTFSMFDTFLGMAVSGPLREIGLQLEQIPVVTSTWGAWKDAHPETTIVSSGGGIGRVYPADPLRGRDDNGPIFPIGDVDPRLPVQAAVVGVITDDGIPLAFPVEAALLALDQGLPVTFEDISVVSDGDGLIALRDDGTQISSHQAFWFAWSQFHPDTGVWVPFG